MMAYSGESAKTAPRAAGCNYGLAFYGRRYANHSHRVLISFFPSQVGIDMLIQNRYSGVIERVSMLFHGNPYLIEGFNTFLPRATTSMPLPTLTIPALLPSLPPRHYDLQNRRWNSWTRFIVFGSPLPFGPPAAGSRPDSPLARLHPPQTFSPAPQGLTTAVASVLGNMGNKTQVERAPAAELTMRFYISTRSRLVYPMTKTTRTSNS